MDRYILDKLAHRIQELQSYIHPDKLEITGLYYSEQDAAENCRPEFDDSGWDVLKKGQEWGGRDKVIWIRTSFTIPLEFQGQPLDLEIEAGPKEDMDIRAEAMLYLNGTETCAFDNWHVQMRLNDSEMEIEPIQLALRVWSGMIEEDQRRHFKGIWLKTVNVDSEKYYYLSKIIWETIEELDTGDYRGIVLTKLLNDSFLMIDYQNPKSRQFYDSIGRARDFLEKGLSSMRRLDEHKPTVAVCGHTHIDMAWLWRLTHTVHKGARSFATVLHLMERYPEYCFSQSSPLLYEMIEKEYPKLFNKICEKIDEGRWEVTGGMWVEPDTNIPGGESLVRQLLLGKKYIRERFHKDTTILWLPDVFGYSWVLPQILKKSGIRLFWTNKMSWNQYNRIPYDTFYWRGMDGSEIMTQLGTCPEKDVTWGSTYNGVIAPWEVKGTWDKYQQKDINDEVFMPFGWGDGGGGPTREMLEAYDVMRDLPGLPRVEMKQPEEFAGDLINKLKDKEVPVWDGELYFEYHRGTYTSQAFVKRENRKCEVLYHDIELFSILRDNLTGEKHYPQKALETNWKRICTNQFHDIIPGSGIHEVYEDAAVSYALIRAEGEKMLDEALQGITDEISADADGIVVFNSLPWKRKACITLENVPEGIGLFDGDTEILAQRNINAGKESAVYMLEGIAPCGYKTYQWRPTEAGLKETPNPNWNGILETPYYRAVFNDAGQMTQLYDKEYRRNVLKTGSAGNELCVFEDKPHQFDAWNTEIYAYEKCHVITGLESIEIEETGPIKTVLRLLYHYNRSKIEQRITFYSKKREIIFDTVADWQEEHALLKVCFDTQIRAVNAVYDVQFGNLERPTHSNTSWDYAQFEVCAHKWADLSEGNYGVALLNDCKYGYDIKNSKMRLTLIKTSDYPDKTADLGRHQFSYALLPHGGTWRDADVGRAAYEFNFPVYQRNICGGNQGIGESECFLVKPDNKNIIVETIKKAEDSDAWILRVYEYMQCRGEVTLHFGKQPQHVYECDLMENELWEISVQNEAVTCEITPYEIKTLKVVMQDNRL